MAPALTKKQIKELTIASRQQVLYSDDSFKRLMENDTQRYDVSHDVIKQCKSSSSQSVYLLNRKYKFRQFIAYP